MNDVIAHREVRTFRESEFRYVEPADGAPPRIEGYAAVFDAPSEDLGGFREVVKPGAFKRSLAGGADVRLLINHDGLPLARTKSGTLTLAEDSRGLRFSAALDPTDPDVQALVPKMKRGDVNQCSFAFTTDADGWGMNGQQRVRELREVSIDDVSVVTYPAYPQTAAAVRSLRKWRAGVPGAGKEQRATMEVQDDSLIYLCRWTVMSARDSFDAMNRVLDAVNGVDAGTLDDRDTEAAEDLVSTLVDLIGKCRKTKATLEALGVEDETDDADDDKPLVSTPAVSDPMSETEAMLALAELE